MPKFTTPTPDRVLRRKVAAERVGLTVRQLERLEAAGRFPRKVKLSDRACGWLEADVSAWIRARVAASLRHAAEQAYEQRARAALADAAPTGA